MTRIAKRIVGSFAYCVLVLGAVSACASEEPTFRQDAGAMPKQCDPNFCPATPTGQGCCLMDGTCGVNTGMGCAPNKKDSGP